MAEYCYNRGCGQKYLEKDNHDEACTHHPGAPIFHDAYKGWSCCKKKCTDFTEFLNIKGCTRSRHSNIKPIEPEKPESSKTCDVIEYKAPEPLKPMMERPPFDAPLAKLKHSISPSLQQELAQMKPSVQIATSSTNEIRVGAACKNGGCKETYVNEASNDSICRHHPGFPIFHEGLKYWTCCTRRTTDFQQFLNQEGCSEGPHAWMSEQDERNKSAMQCRHDWMQSGTHIVVNVYCKKYDPSDVSLTFVEANPVRLRIQILFPANGSFYKTDMELHGVIDPGASSVLYTPSKVEIKLRKAEPMAWKRLDVPRQPSVATPVKEKEELPKVDALDLSDL